MCKLGLHISSAGGTWWVCMWRPVGGILAGGVCICVCVCVYTDCVSVRMDLWVCVPLPLVFLTSKTLTSSEKGSYYPQLIITDQNNNFRFPLKKEYFVLITVVARTNIIVHGLWKISTISEPLSLPSSLCLKFSTSLYLFSPSFHEGPSARARESTPPRSRAACSDPAPVFEPPHIQTEAFKHSPAAVAQQEAQWACVMSSVSAISTWMRFHYFVKGKRTGINKPDKEDIFCILSSV